MWNAMATAGLTCAMLSCLGCSNRQAQIIEPSFSYLSASQPTDDRAIWPVHPAGVTTLAEARGHGAMNPQQGVAPQLMPRNLDARP